MILHFAVSSIVEDREAVPGKSSTLRWAVLSPFCANSHIVEVILGQNIGYNSWQEILPD